MAGDPLVLLGEQAPGEAVPARGELVGERDLAGDQIAPERRQLLEPQPLGRGRRDGRDIQPLGGERQNPGVDPVGLGQPPERVGELAGAVGVEHDHRDAPLGERREDREVHPPGRLQRDAADLEAAEPADELAHPRAGVGTRQVVCRPPWETQTSSQALHTSIPT